jgi:hypothetical protein
MWGGCAWLAGEKLHYETRRLLSTEYRYTFEGLQLMPRHVCGCPLSGSLLIHLSSCELIRHGGFPHGRHLDCGPFTLIDSMLFWAYSLTSTPLDLHPARIPRMCCWPSALTRPSGRFLGCGPAPIPSPPTSQGRGGASQVDGFQAVLHSALNPWPATYRDPA